MKKEKNKISPEQSGEKKNNKLTKVKENYDYPAKDDIYNKGKEDTDLDPEDISKVKSPNEIPGMRNEKTFGDVVTGVDLDVPGSELDDEQENIGSEDEENNYYSIGGDNHNDLDED
jgi:hypothetical protein